MLLPLLSAMALARDFILPPIPVPAQDPGAVPSPYEDRVPTPSLSGSTSSLNLEALAHEITEFTIEADVSGLTAVTTENLDAVIRHLAADPRWRVVEAPGGAMIAIRREKDGGEWTAPLRGYIAAKDGLWRAVLRFDAWDPADPWASSPLVSRTDAMSPKATLRAFNAPEHKGWQAVAMAWEAPAVALEIYDASKAAELESASAILGSVPNYLDVVATHAAEIRARGYDPRALPFREPRRSDPWVEAKSPAPGELDVRARVHPPGFGYTWIRLDDENLQPWEELAVATGTREIVGWSSVEREQFYMQGRFPVPSGEGFTGTAEVWFQAMDGGAPILLGATPVRVPKR